MFWEQVCNNLKFNSNASQWEARRDEYLLRGLWLAWLNESEEISRRGLRPQCRVFQPCPPCGTEHWSTFRPKNLKTPGPSGIKARLWDAHRWTLPKASPSWATFKRGCKPDCVLGRCQDGRQFVRALQGEACCEAAFCCGRLPSRCQPGRTILTFMTVSRRSRVRSPRGHQEKLLLIWKLTLGQRLGLVLSAAFCSVYILRTLPAFPECVCFAHQAKLSPFGPPPFPHLAATWPHSVSD